MKRKPRACPGPGCAAVLGTGHEFCGTHWYRLPIALRTEIVDASKRRDMLGKARAVGAALKFLAD